MHYHRAETIEELKELLKLPAGQIHILAGGTDALVEARQHPFNTDTHFIDISRTPLLRTIEEHNGQLIIGAAVTHQELATNPDVRQYAALLADASSRVGSLQIRNRGTIGGNICNASPCADTVPPLMVLDAEVEVLNSKGTRTVPISDFFYKPYRPRLEPDDLVLKIKFKKLSNVQRSAFYKLGRRKALAISRINMATVLQLTDDKTITEARIAPGSVFPAWIRVKDAENFLRGEKASSAVFTEAGKIVAAEMVTVSGRRWSTPYKEPVVAALVKRTLMLAADLYKGGKE